MAKGLRKKKGASDPRQTVSNASTFRPAPGAPASTWRSWLPRALLIAGMTLWIYWPALRGELIWDDEWYITMNPLLHDWTGLWKFWFQPGSWVEYYPLQETVQWVQWHLWGDDTLGYHLTSLALHVINALLVWHLLGKFGLRLAWLGGLIFAVHPVQVESVAYVSELKNTLSLPFFLLAMSAWIDYEEGRSKRDYRKALGLFLVAMLCKISMAPFAAVILLYAWWKRGRVAWSDVKGCAPFLLIAIVLAFATIWAGIVYEKIGHAVIPSAPLDGVFSRIDAVGLIASIYFARCFLPVDLLLSYAQWPLHPHAFLQYLPWFGLAGVLYVSWRKRQAWGRHVLLGLGFFLLMLSPFLGFTSVSYMNFIWAMDHFLYIPIIGLIGLVVAGLGGIDAQFPAWSRPFTVGIVAGLVGLMAWVSHAWAGLFVSGEVFWSYVLQRNPTVWLAHANLGCRLLELDRFQEAMVQEKEAVMLRPDSGDSYYNLAIAFEKLGRTREAQEAYRKALSFNPANPKIYLNLGEMARHSGNVVEAETLFRQGLKISPDDASLCTDLAGILLQTGRISEVIGLYEHAIEFNPDMGQLHYDLGVALLQAGSVQSAAEHLETAVALDPKIAAAHENLGVAQARLGRLPEAIEQFEAALQIDPHLGKTRDNLALALAQTGHLQEAMEQFQKALQLNPDDATARASLAKLRQFEMRRNAPGGK